MSNVQLSIRIGARTHLIGVSALNGVLAVIPFEPGRILQGRLRRTEALLFILNSSWMRPHFIKYHALVYRHPNLSLAKGCMGRGRGP